MQKRLYLHEFWGNWDWERTRERGEDFSLYLYTWVLKYIFKSFSVLVPSRSWYQWLVLVHQLIKSTEREHAQEILNLSKDLGIKLSVFYTQAARDGRLDIVKNKLAKHKRDVNMKDNENCTALHYAVRFNHLEIVKFLLKKGASMYILRTQ